MESGIESREVIEDNLKGRISTKQIIKLLSPIKSGDTVVVTTLSHLGKSINMLVTVLRTLYDRGVTIVTLDGKTYPPDSATLAMIESMEFTINLAAQIKARQSYESANGKAGRPRGTTKSIDETVLRGKTEQLMKLLGDGLSINKISGIIGVSRGTISNYLKKMNP